MSSAERNHCAGSMELAIRFATWAERFSYNPDIPVIMARFSVSKATAFRWRRALTDARGAMHKGERRVNQVSELDTVVS